MPSAERRVFYGVAKLIPGNPISMKAAKKFPMLGGSRHMWDQIDTPPGFG